MDGIRASVPGQVVREPAASNRGRPRQCPTRAQGGDVVNPSQALLGDVLLVLAVILRLFEVDLRGGG
jgi:hypothetical protein